MRLDFFAEGGRRQRQDFREALNAALPRLVRNANDETQGLHALRTRVVPIAEKGRVARQTFESGCPVGSGQFLAFAKAAKGFLGFDGDEAAAAPRHADPVGKIEAKRFGGLAGEDGDRGGSPFTQSGILSGYRFQIGPGADPAD